MAAAKDLNPSLKELQKVVHENWSSKLSILDFDEVCQNDSKIESAIVIAQSSDADAGIILDLAIDKGLTHICQSSGISLDREIQSSALMLSDQSKFLNYPVSSILDPNKAGSKSEDSLRKFSIKFSRATDKPIVIDKLKQYVESVVRSGSVVIDICGVADELFTNAVFNAPFSDPKSPSNPGIDRTNQKIEMPQGFSAEIFVGTDQDQLVIGCRDPYGSLDLNSLLKRIRDCYNKGLAETMNMDSSGGAGIGSYMVYNAGAGYYVGVKRGVATIVCCVIPLKMSSSKRAALPKNLHFFESQGE